MARYLFFVLWALLLTGICCGQGLDGLMEDFTLEIDIPRDQVPEDLEIHIYVVYGSDLDLIERLMIDSILSGDLSTQARASVSAGEDMGEIDITKKILHENETSIDELVDGTTVVVLVGGQGHNRFTDKVYAEGLIKNESTKYGGYVTIGRGIFDNDSNIMVLYHKRVEKLERGAVNYSPLKEIISEEYVPVAAAGIGILLLGFFNIFQELIESFIESFGRRKAKFQNKDAKAKKIHVNESIAVLCASIVLGFSITWTFTGPTMEFFNLIILNSGICFIAILSHELGHRLMGRVLGIEMEYRFWLRGSVITIFTAFLGNCFGVPGFLMERKNSELSKWKNGVVKLVGPLISLSITAVFAFMFLKNPSIIYQMIYSTSIILAMAEILPTKGLDGEDIKNWNWLIWTLMLALITAVYLLVNFIQ